MLRDVPEHGEPKVSRLQRSPPRAQAPRRINRPSRIARLQLRTHDARTHKHTPSSVRPSPRPIARVNTHTHTIRAGHTTQHTTHRVRAHRVSVADHAPHATTPPRERAPRTHRSRSRSPPRARARTAPPPRPTCPCRPLRWGVAAARAPPNLGQSTNHEQESYKILKAWMLRKGCLGVSVRRSSVGGGATTNRWRVVRRAFVSVLVFARAFAFGAGGVG